MKQNIYAIRDVKVQSYMRPFPGNHVEEVKRSVAQACLDPETSLAKYPQDYELFFIGSFDDEKGTFENAPNGPRHITGILELKLKAEEATGQINMFRKQRSEKDEVGK